MGWKTNERGLKVHEKENTRKKNLLLKKQQQTKKKGGKNLYFLLCWIIIFPIRLISSRILYDCLAANVSALECNKDRQSTTITSKVQQNMLKEKI